MESWRTVWRESFAKILPLKGLHGLREALANDDPRLIQGATCNPPPLMANFNEEAKGGCLIGLCGILGGNCRTVHEVEEFFTRTCVKADHMMGNVAECRWVLGYFDDTPRDEMRRELLAEVDLAIQTREQGAK